MSIHKKYTFWDVGHHMYANVQLRQHTDGNMTKPLEINNGIHLKNIIG